MRTFLNMCRDGDMHEVTEVLKSYKLSRASFLKQRDSNGWSCLHWATWHRDIECVKYLLSLKQLDINAKDNAGRTPFYLALLPQTMYQTQNGVTIYRRELPLEVVKMLLEANNNDSSFFEGLCDGPLEIAMMSMCHSFDVVKMLVDFGRSQGHNCDIFWHCSAMYRRVDCMRYLLYQTNQDPKKRNKMGWPACFIFFQNVLRDAVVSSKEINFGLELLSITCKYPVKTVEVFFLLIDCFRYKDYRNDKRAYNIFMKIVKLLIPKHPMQYFVVKISQATLRSDYSLITLTLFENIHKSIPNCKLAPMEKQRYLVYLENLKSNFLQELFALYLADESFCCEYITQIKRMGWTFNEFEMLSVFCSSLTVLTSMQKLFSFTKILILHEFCLVSSIAPSTLLLPAHMDEHFLTVFVPLSNFVHPPIELTWIFGSEKNDCHYNCIETENCVNDYHAIIHRKSNHREVVSLKNLSRMSVRKYMFKRYSQFEALSLLYSVEIPIQLRQFLCYNYANLKF